MDASYFHILNRGIEKSKIFFSDDDYLRFVLGLYRFNNKKGALRTPRRKEPISNLPKQDEKLVEILKWTLIPNHYHLLVQERIPGGAVEFAKRIGNGYTKYINIKSNRSGYLFQNSAKIIEIQDDPHLRYLPVYIDLNVVDLIEPNWKERGIGDVDKTLRFLEAYRWSSYRDCVGIPNFPEIINTELFYDEFEMTADAYKEEVFAWLNRKDWSTCQVDQLKLVSN